MDYLSAIGEHLRYTLREKLGEGVMRNTPLEFVVTVPAIWSDLAKQKTIQACQNAAGLTSVVGAGVASGFASGFASGSGTVPAVAPKITLVSEPEAAAIYALHGLDPHDLKIDDSFVVCDAGGGTVDLISYTITGLKPILEVKEATPGSGALCGSTFLNRRFSSFLTAKLGDQAGFDDELLADALDRFEKIVCSSQLLGKKKKANSIRSNANIRSKPRRTRRI